jgi:hypothetical protein
MLHRQDHDRTRSFQFVARGFLVLDPSQPASNYGPAVSRRHKLCHPLRWQARGARDSNFTTRVPFPVNPRAAQRHCLLFHVCFPF